MIGLELAAGYLIAWAVRKARHVAGRLDGEVDAALDVGLDRLHGVVAAQLGEDSALRALEEEARDGDAVADRTRTRVMLALEDAAEKDPQFARALADVLEQLNELKEQAAAGGIDLRGASGVQVNQASGNLQVNRFS
ncbi:hypothetical protein ABZ721_30610 [Streptomyces sp. NPDC006733]|uniref:hypothetical protein n=1 Tax=Streptomyces sp. NPDC006733 TaxID=3155460 RepID=UPI0034065770